MPAESQPLEKFQRLLLEMFRSDRTDLDFGIYRILNHKRDAIEGFIRDTLPGKIKADLEGEYRQKEQASDTLKDVARRVKATLGHDAIGPDGDLNETYRKSPLGIEYQQAKEQAADMGGRASMESDIYNHLYAFFNRYYQDGDFVSKRRISGGNHRYAVPYNGEEVYLHWANSDQYYVKTAEYFSDYEWKTSGGLAVRFELRNADVEHDNVKGDKRFFLPLVDKIQWDETGKKAVIPFEYRSLTPREGKEYGKGGQSKIVSAAVRDILNRADGMSPDLAAALRSERGSNGKSAVSHLEYHLIQYTRRNTSDFFVHKDLKGFLSNELDTYLKSEVLNLDEMESTGERNAAGWFQKMWLIKSVGGKIIDFLAQIEDFQKMLWEKRKFVAETHYCVAVGSIDQSLYRKIASNQRQWAEWCEMLSIGDVSRKVDFIKKHPTLMVDTKHFDQDFVDNLLAGFDLDAVTDGLLVHGENWQTLRLLYEKYKETVSLVYVDPTYNTGKDDFLYKDNYQHSTWLSMMDNLMPFWLSVLTDRGSFVSHIDEHEFNRLSELMDMRFGVEQNVGPVVWDKRNPKGDATAIATRHEYLCWAVKDYVALKRSGQGLFRKKPNAQKISSKAREIIRSHGGVTDAARAAFKKWVTGQEFSGGEKAYCNLDDEGCVYRSVSMAWPNKKQAPDDYFRPLIHPITGKPCPVPARGWRSPPDTMATLLKQGKILFGLDETVQPTRKYLLRDYFNENVPSLYDFGGSDDDLQKSLGYSFPTAKPLRIGEYVVSIAAVDTDAVVLDCFAGSGTTGHTVINLNREDCGHRKFILVEMGEYFDTVLLPRIKKVAYTPEWKEGKPKRAATDEEAKRGPHIVKYMRLESYEDALDNIEFGSGGQSQVDRFGDYLLKYMLEWETRGSNALLNVDRLASPFSYTLRLRANGESKDKAVDIPETFNYLLGLNVRSRRAYDDKGRRYLAYRGRTRGEPGRDVAVIWRETVGWKKRDFERDKSFVKKHGLAAEDGSTYVNGDSLIPGARPVEGLFRDRMFVGIGA